LGGGWVISEKILAQQKLLKNIVPWEKNNERELSAIFILSVDIKRILAQAIAYQKDHAQPKGKKKISCARKLPSPLVNIMVRH